MAASMSILVNTDAATQAVGTLTQGLATNTVYTQLSVTALSAPIAAFAPIILRTGLGAESQAIASQAAVQGATTVNIQPFLTNVAYDLTTQLLIPNPTMRDVLPLLKSALGISQGNAERDQDLVLLADLAMAKYNELRPKVLRAYQMSVSGQIQYTLPQDCRRVTDCAIPSQYGYYNDWLFLPMIDTPSSSLFGYSDYAFRAPSERIVREGILNELDHYAQAWSAYYVEYQPSPTLYVLPQSTASGIPLQVRYLADHANQSIDPMNPLYNDLMPGDWKHYLTLLKWALVDSYADMLTSPLALSTSDGGNGNLTESWKLGNRADRLLLAARMAMGVDRTTVVRS